MNTSKIKEFRAKEKQKLLEDEIAEKEHREWEKEWEEASKKQEKKEAIIFYTVILIFVISLIYFWT